MARSRVTPRAGLGVEQRVEHDLLAGRVALDLRGQHGDQAGGAPVGGYDDQWRQGTQDPLSHRLTALVGAGHDRGRALAGSVGSIAPRPGPSRHHGAPVVAEPIGAALPLSLAGFVSWAITLVVRAS